MKTLEEMIAVMQAAKEGKEIEVKNGQGAWLTEKAPTWSWGYFDYRVKPEPIEPLRLVGIRLKDRPLLSAWTTNYAAAMSIDGEVPRDAEIVDFIELTPEVKAKLGL